MARLDTSSGVTEVGLERATAKLAKGAGITLGGNIVGRSLHALVQIAVARLLGPEGFGIYAIGWTVLRIFGSLAQVGLNSGVIRYASMHRMDDSPRLKGVLLQAIGFACLAGILLAGIMYGVSSWLADVVFKKPELAGMLKMFAVGIPLMAVLMVAAAGTRVSQRMQYSVYAQDLLRPALNLGLVLLFYLLGWRLFGATLACVVSFGVSLVVAVYYLNLLFPQVLSGEVRPVFQTKELLLFSMPLLLVGFLSMLIMWTDTLMLGYFKTASEVGVYRAAAQVALLLTMGLAAINSIFAPMIAELHHQKLFQTLCELFKVSAKWSFYLTIPFFLLILFCAHELLETIYGKSYVAGAVSLTILSTAQLVNVMTGSVGNLLIMSGHQRVWVANTLGMAIMNIVLNRLLIPQFGINGAAIATGVSIAGLFVLGLAETRLILNMSPHDRRYLKGVVAALFSATVGLGLRVTVVNRLPMVAGVLTQLLLILATFTLVLVVLGFDSEDRTVWRGIHRRLGSTIE